MALQSFLKIFMPKNKVFYELFEKIAENAATMGSLLRGIIAEPDFDKRAALIIQVEDLEHVNDELTHNVFTELGRNFITPFDREDIHYLATSLDDIADYIYAAAKKINFYRVNPNDTGMQKFAELIEQAAFQVKIAVTELRDVFDMSIEKLFDTEPDAKEVIKKREIYQVMEIVTDKCEDASNVIESIIIKYA